MRTRTGIALLALAALVAACGKKDGEEPQGAATETVGGEKAGSASGEPTTTTTTTAAPAASGAVIQAQEVNGAAGMVAELTEATREDGVLTIKLRLRNTGTEERYKSFETNHGAYTLFYVTAENQKYFILKDSEGEPLAPVYLTVTLGPGETSTWWGKYPAPPSSVTEFDFIMHEVPPFENIPITDR